MHHGITVVRSPVDKYFFPHMVGPRERENYHQMPPLVARAKHVHLACVQNNGGGRERERDQHQMTVYTREIYQTR